jgi:hypothetical protein
MELPDQHARGVSSAEFRSPALEIDARKPSPLISPDAAAKAGFPAVAHAEFQEVNALAVGALLTLFDGATQLFSNRPLRPQEVFVHERIVRRDTVIALLGLRCLDDGGGEHPFHFPSIENAVFEDLRWTAGIGDLGLLLWYAARHAPQRLATLLQDCDLQAALDNSRGARDAHTQDLSCFLAGLAYAKLGGYQAPIDITDLAVETYQKLTGNQGEDGIFTHRGLRTRLDGWTDGRFGTFTDQAYAIYALTKFADAFAVDESLGAALDCASAICALQGPMGEWWWLYDARRGCVACRYPVLAGTQAGTAPAALMALQEATGMNFQAPVSKGLRWIFGENELASDLRELNQSGISASLTRDFSGAKYVETVLSLLGISADRMPIRNVRLTHEPAVEHCGWPLYCFGKFGLKTSPAVVGV